MAPDYFFAKIKCDYLEINYYIILFKFIISIREEGNFLFQRLLCVHRHSFLCKIKCK